MDLLSLFLTVIPYIMVFIFLSIIMVFTLVLMKSNETVELSKDEESYFDPTTLEKLTFPKITDPHSVNMSVVVPAYNEEARLPPMLDETLEFLETRRKQHPNYKYEVIVVSDGSADKTVEVAHSYSTKYGSDKVRCLRLVRNRGKGGAVKLGIQSSRGAVILFADADGASKFEDLCKLEAGLKENVQLDPITQSEEISKANIIVIGSRAHLENEALATRSFVRNILMYGFHFLVWLFTVKGVKDTQCGFKLFTRKTANVCFESLHVNRWAFDVELLYIAQKLHIPIVEIPIRWTEIDGSKVTPVISWIQMGLDLGLIWLRYKIGVWKIKHNKLD